MKHHHGWVEVIAGCMFSGKTEELVRRLRRARYAKQKVAAFKPHIDDRYDEVQIVSHEGIERYDAMPVKLASDIFDQSKDAQVVGIDEAQFFDETLAEIVELLAGSGKRVIIAGLDMDFRGAPFGVMPNLLARADEVTKTVAVCLVCGGRATRSQRVVDSTEQVLIGNEAVYQARCRAHWGPEPTFTQRERMDALEG